MWLACSGLKDISLANKRGDVTETIAAAMEHADQMEHVLIIYQNKEDTEISHGFFQNDSMQVQTANYLCDVFKSWIINSLRSRSTHDEI